VSRPRLRLVTDADTPRPRRRLSFLLDADVTTGLRMIALRDGVKVPDLLQRLARDYVARRLASDEHLAAAVDAANDYQRTHTTGGTS